MTADNSALSSASRFSAALERYPAGGKVAALFLAGLATFALTFLAAGWLRPVEDRLGALGWTLFSDGGAEERITLVVVDEKSLAEIGPWPWPRGVMADLVNAIDQAGAQLQIHDIVYPEPRPGDEFFRDALLSASGSVIAQVPALDAMPGATSTGVMSYGLESPGCAASGLDVASASSFVAPARVFEGVPKGHNAALIESDGGVRRSPALVCVGETLYPSLSLAAFLQLGVTSGWSVSLLNAEGPFQPHSQLTLKGYPGLRIPLDREGAMRINFRKSPDSFRAVSASDVISGNFDRSFLENAWVIVGGTAFGLADIVPTPYSGAAFGVELQARLLASILDMEVPYTPAGAPIFQLLLMSIFGTCLYLASTSGGRINAYGLPILAVVLPFSALGTHIWALHSLNFWIGWIGPATFGLLAAGSILLLELAQARLERGRVYQTLSSYLSPMVAREVAFSLPSSKVDAQRQDVTLLSADIRNFSAFGESRPPEEIAAILHYFNVHVNGVIESFGGRVAEFRGDSVLAIWEGAGSSDAGLALDAANSLQNSLSEKLLADHQLLGLEPLALGIGIEQGPVLLGSIGPSHRRSFTLLGDTVSTTLRIREMTEDLAQPVLLGATVARQLPGRNLQSQGSYLLPGLSIPHTLFAPPAPAEVMPIRGSRRRDSRDVA